MLISDKSLGTFDNSNINSAEVLHRLAVEV